MGYELKTSNYKHHNDYRDNSTSLEVTRLSTFHIYHENNIAEACV